MWRHSVWRLKRVGPCALNLRRQKRALVLAEASNGCSLAAGRSRTEVDPPEEVEPPPTGGEAEVLAERRAGEEARGPPAGPWIEPEEIVGDAWKARWEWRVCVSGGGS